MFSGCWRVDGDAGVEENLVVIGGDEPSLKGNKRNVNLVEVYFYHVEREL